jgi:hypothetical protein
MLEIKWFGSEVKASRMDDDATDGLRFRNPEAAFDASEPSTNDTVTLLPSAFMYI